MEHEHHHDSGHLPVTPANDETIYQKRAPVVMPKEEKSSSNAFLPSYWLTKLLDVYHENFGSSFMGKGTLSDDIERRSGHKILFWCRG